MTKKTAVGAIQYARKRRQRLITHAIWHLGHPVTTSDVRNVSSPPRPSRSPENWGARCACHPELVVPGAATGFYKRRDRFTNLRGRSSFLAPTAFLPSAVNKLQCIWRGNVHRSVREQLLLDRSSASSRSWLPSRSLQSNSFSAGARNSARLR